jgi:hypothetical protein
MANRDRDKKAEEWLEMRPHDEFLELCAVSTAGDLTGEEQNRLRAHLAGCPECRQALKDYEIAADVGAPLLSSKLSAIASDRSLSSRSVADDEPALLGGVTRERSLEEAKRGFAFAQKSEAAQPQVNWNHAWMPFAACVLLTISLGIYSYRFGGTREVVHLGADSDMRLQVLERRISDARHEQEVLGDELSQRDKTIAELRRQTELESRSLNEMKNAQSNLQHLVQNDDAEKQRISDERSILTARYDAAQEDLKKMQSELNSTQQRRADDAVQDASLESEVKELSAQIHEQRQALDKQEDLLSHDRDIRELMGARDLYVAEVYDVARDGSTQKATGRVFYTKGKSLIFYAYDLDQEPGIRNASTFQAWGRRGPDREQALNLGIFYEDNAAKKRWILKFNDPKALDQIDAVFVTVEPKGGSRKPSGKPLLYAYLQLAPNHP